jgi:hypothetical protein
MGSRVWGQMNGRSPGVYDSGLPARHKPCQFFFNILIFIFFHLYFYILFYFLLLFINFFCCLPRFNDIAQNQSVRKLDFLHCKARVPRQSVHKSMRATISRDLPARTPGIGFQTHQTALHILK